MAPDTDALAWLVRRSGPLEGRRFLLKTAVTRIGRDPRGEIVLAGGDAAVVSGRHAEVRRETSGFHIYDLGSMNGLYVNGEKLDSRALVPGDVLELGSGGPRFEFESEQLEASDLDRTILALPKARTALPQSRAPQSRPREVDSPSASTAVRVQRLVEAALVGGHRKWRRIAIALAASLALIVALIAWSLWSVRERKDDIEVKIAEIEDRMASADLSDEEAAQLESQLEAYQEEAGALRENLLFRMAGFDDEVIFVESELRSLLEAFGAEQYYLPPDFVARVQHYVALFTGEDRGRMSRALHISHETLEQMQARFAAYRLPPELAYVAVAESALRTDSESPQGAVGIWQFRPNTARQFGLEVNAETDERLDPIKSTEAAARYFRDLILEFGAGSSVMLAIAAYNVGPTRMRGTIRRIEDPIQQRNFWYLYRTRKLPAQTREYVPRVLAAIIIGRNPKRYGFE